MKWTLMFAGLVAVAMTGCVNLDEDDAPFSTKKMDEHAWKIDQELQGAHEQTMKRSTKWFDDDDTPPPAYAPAGKEEEVEPPTEKKHNDKHAERKVEKKIEKQVEKPAEGQRGFLGIQYSQAKEGVQVDSVIDGTAAQMAGLAQGDVITRVNGTRINTTEQFLNTIGGMKPGTSATIAFSRGGVAHEAKVTLGARPVEEKQIQKKHKDEDEDEDDGEEDDDD